MKVNSFFCLYNKTPHFRFPLKSSRDTEHKDRWMSHFSLHPDTTNKKIKKHMYTNEEVFFYSYEFYLHFSPSLMGPFTSSGSNSVKADFSREG